MPPPPYWGTQTPQLLVTTTALTECALHPPPFHCRMADTVELQNNVAYHTTIPPSNRGAPCYEEVVIGRQAKSTDKEKEPVHEYDEVMGAAEVQTEEHHYEEPV